MTINNVPVNGLSQSLPTTCLVGCSSTAASGNGAFNFAGTSGQAIVGAVGAIGYLTTGNGPHGVGAATIWAKP